jgi:hypothetical protein
MLFPSVGAKVPSSVIILISTPGNAIPCLARISNFFSDKWVCFGCNLEAVPKEMFLSFPACTPLIPKSFRNLQ